MVATIVLLALIFNLGEVQTIGLPMIYNGTNYIKISFKKGFKINPYDIGVANQIINIEQYTILCHVDYNKLSNVENKVNYEIAKDKKKVLGI